VSVFSSASYPHGFNLSFSAIHLGRRELKNETPGKTRGFCHEISINISSRAA